MEAFHPGHLEDEQHSHFWHFPVRSRGLLWSAIAAFAEEFSYSYDYITQFVEHLNSRGFGYIEEPHPNLPIPTRLEFLEILEFREDELRRVLSDAAADHEWQWPVSWGHVPWNCRVAHLGQARSVREYDLRSTSTAIAVQKCLLGENTPLQLGWVARELIADFFNLFLEHGRFRALPQLIPVLNSYDVPAQLRLSRQQDEGLRHWDVDQILGLYDGHYAGSVRVFRRAAQRCATQLGLNEAHLLNVVVIHELAHWLVRWFGHDNVSVTHRESALRAWHDESDEEVRESWAQLLTHFAAEKRHIGLETFNKLVQAQSRAYQRYQEVLAVCSDPRVILDSLIVLREDGKGGTFDQWMDVLRKLL